uniref:Transmembrane protein n=1 Tax=Rhizophora mucronata TaxID=61149 RepID=A0A2P2QIS3_RHIMU
MLVKQRETRGMALSFRCSCIPFHFFYCLALRASFLFYFFGGDWVVHEY